jgi:membrane protease YdiL (CAAX protease family)
VPYGGAELLLAVFLCLTWPMIAYAVLDGAGLFERLYGPERVGLVRAHDGPQEQPDAAPQRRLVLLRFNLWAAALAFPFQAATIPLLLYAVSGTRPAQLGLTTRHLGPNLLAGFIAFVAVAPVVLGLNYLVETLYRWALGGGTQAHPLTLIARERLMPAEWVLLVLTGTVTAPVLEELIFRGMLQPWFAARSWGGPLALCVALGIAVFFCAGRVRDVWPHGPGAALIEAAPALFILALVPVCLLVMRRSRTPAAGAVCGTAVLFAAIHSSVWPSPIALVVLGLALGVLAWRTGSLVGPILLHSLFNGVACAQLLWTA